MTPVRRALGLIAAIWLLSQAATLALVTLSSAATPECVCTSGNGAMCPMHHHASTAGLKACAMQDPSAAVPAGLQSLFSAVGYLPVSSPLDVQLRATSPSRIAYPAPRTVSSSPEPPPPRA